MKTLEYAKKYNLTNGINFSHSEFIQDFTTDFLTLLEVGKNGSGEYTFKGFENTVRAIRMKWDGINNKTLGKLPDSLWKYFYATVIIKLKKDLFKEEMDKLKQEKEDRKKSRERRNKYNDFDFGFSDYVFDMFSFLYGKSNIIPQSSFDILCIPNDSSEDIVKNSYRNLAKKHHPDKGGNQKTFVDITEAKNKCLNYLKNKL